MTDPADRLRTALAAQYRIERELGAGGMATVYLAHDLKHDRDVALKVLNPELGAEIGAERFLQEIKTTARLQHPHILGLIDSGEALGLLFYVMPFVSVESLRNRLTREKQLPIPEAVRIATEVASALDYAHRHGVVHRDIKPENVLLHDGQAMVADFGIALAVTVAGGGRMTQTGMSLGTPHYMSPEQALGEKEITPRSDVYALGAMTYEMLTGDPPFTGSTAQAILAKVLTERPVPPRTTREMVPPHIEAAVLTAMAKLPADRWGTAKEFADALANPSLTAATVAVRSPSPARGARILPWAVVGAALVLAGILAPRPSAPAPDRVTAAVLPLEIRTPSDLPLNEVGPPIAIAPDGSYLVFVGPDPEVPRMTALWRRSLDQLEAVPIPGTRGAQRPATMPDGKTVQFFKRDAAGTGNARWEIDLEGGLPISAPPTNGLRRLRDGRVLVAADSGGLAVLNPGDPIPAVAPRAALTQILSAPDISPDGKWLARGRRLGQADSIVLHIVGRGRPHVIGAGVSPKFLENDLLAFRAPDGTLVYAAGGSAAQSRLVWVEGGDEQAIPNSDSRVYGGLALSPDGRAVSFVQPLRAGGAARRRDAPLVSLRAVDASAPADSLPGPWPDPVDELVWSPDARFLALRTRRGGANIGRYIAVRAVDGDSLRWFAVDDSQERGPRFSPDDKWLLYVSDRSGRDEVYAESFPAGGMLAIDMAGIENWDLHPDGKRILLTVVEAAPTAPAGGPAVPAFRYLMALNWFTELKARVGGARR